MTLFYLMSCAARVTENHYHDIKEGRGFLFQFEQAHEFGGGMWQTGTAAGNDVKVAGNVELLDLNFLQPAVFDLPFDAHARHNCHPHAHLHETFDAFDGGHFERHVEGRTVLGEQLDDAAAEWGFHDVGDKHLFTEFFDFHFATLGQRVLRRHDEGEFVFQDFGGLE